MDVAPRRRLIGAGAGLVALVVAAPLALSACSGNSGHATSSAGTERGPAMGAAAPQAKQDLSQGDAPSASGSNGGGGTSHTIAGGAAVKLPNRSLIITAGLQVKTDDAAAAAQRAQIIAEGAGGYVAGESVGPGPQNTPSAASGSGGASDDATAKGGTAQEAAPDAVTLPGVSGSSNSTQALLVLRVPPQSLDSVLSALPGKGSVTYRSRTATDVTGQVADIASRVGSARAAIAELRALIDKAASMNDLISLEQALAQRESDLESLEAQQKALTDQVQYATITVGYFSQGAAAEPPPVRTGFMRGLTAGWHGFLNVVRGLLATVGWSLPYLAVAVVLWWPARRLVRMVRRGRTKPAPSQPEPDTSAS